MSRRDADGDGDGDGDPDFDDPVTRKKRWVEGAIRNLIPLSVAKSLREALTEWAYTGKHLDYGVACETCRLCDNKGLRYHFEIQNRHNGNVLLIGSTCIRIEDFEFEGADRALADRAQLVKAARLKAEKAALVPARLALYPFGTQRVDDYHARSVEVAAVTDPVEKREVSAVPDAHVAFMAQFGVPAGASVPLVTPTGMGVVQPPLVTMATVFTVSSATEAAAVEFAGGEWAPAESTLLETAEPKTAEIEAWKARSVAIPDEVCEDPASTKRVIVRKAATVAKFGAVSLMVLSEDQAAARMGVVAEVQKLRKDPATPRVAVMVGPAGTGKTTLVRALIVELSKEEYDFRDVVVLAPTGKAAARITEVLGIRATTVHRVLYGSFAEAAFLRTRFDRSAESWATEVLDERGETLEHAPAAVTDVTMARALGATESNEGWKRPISPGKSAPDAPATNGKRELHFGDAHEPCGSNTLLICDEAEMVSAKVHEHLVANLPSGTLLLYVGDREQLPPVKATWGPDLTSPTAALTTIHRQALDSPILRIATDVRVGKGIAPDLVRQGDFMSILLNRRATVDAAAQWLAGRRLAGIDATLICFTNDMRHAANARVRAMRGHPVDRLVVGDFLLMRANNHDFGYMNGEVFEIVEIKDRGDHFAVRFRGRESDLVYVRKDSVGQEQSVFRKWNGRLVEEWERNNMGALETGALHRIFDNPYRRYIHVDIGEVLTCHAALGSEYQEVGIIWEKGLWGMKHRDPEFLRRWSYTAITRARTKLALFLI